MQSTMDVVRPETDAAFEQRMAALEKADRVRLARAQLKRDLKARRVSICDVLADPPEWVGTMPVLQLLLAVPKVGRVKATAMLRGTAGSPRRRRWVVCRCGRSAGCRSGSGRSCWWRWRRTGGVVPECWFSMLPDAEIC
jgi:hypothetical protein